MNVQKIKQFMGVSMPFMLTFGSLCMLLIVGVNGIRGNFMGPIFKFDTRNFAIPPSTFTRLTNINVSGSDNITAASMGLSDKYAFYLWNYASTTGGKTTFHRGNFDYVNKIQLSEITINGVTSSIPEPFSDTRSRLRNEIRFAQMAFLAAIFNAALILAIGVAGSFNIKFRPIIINFFSGVTLMTFLVVAGLITAAGLGTTGDFKPFKPFGLKIDVGTSDLGIVWLAAIHMLVVCIMWLLMALRVMRRNPVLKSVPGRMIDGEQLPQSSSGDDFPMIRRGLK